MKKFELVKKDKIDWLGRELYRIRALISFGTANGRKINIGDMGGYIEKEENLSHDNNAWVFGRAIVFGNAIVHGNAIICDTARIFGTANVCDNAMVRGNAIISGNAHISGDSSVSGNAMVHGDAIIHGDASVYGNANVSDNAVIHGNARIYGNAIVRGYVNISGDVRISGSARVYQSARIYGNANISEDADIFSVGHVFNISPIGTDTSSLTFFRSRNHGIGVSFERNSYTLNEFEKFVANWTDKPKVVALMAIKTAKAYIDLSSATHISNCYHCGKEFDSQLVAEYGITYCPWCGTKI